MGIKRAKRYSFIAKNNEKRKEKKKELQINPHPESIAVRLSNRHGQYRCATSTLKKQLEENKHVYHIHYETADNSAGSSLYEDCVWINLSFTEQLSVSILGISGLF